MMQNYKGNILNLIFSLLFCLLLNGCSDNTYLSDESGDIGQVTARVRFSIRMTGTATRASVSDSEALDEKISSVTVFLVAVNDDGIEDWNNVQHQMIFGAMSKEEVDVYQARIPTNPGKKSVYVGVNLLPAQVNAICENKDGRGLYAATQTGCDDVMKQFVRDADGIVMTGKYLGSTPTIVKEGSDQVMDLTDESIKLLRVVAKVQLLCDTYIVGRRGGDTCVIMDRNLPVLKKGWIRLKDVRYALNTINRKAYLMNVSPDNKDPNYEIDPYVKKGVDGFYVCESGVSEQEFVYRTLSSVWEDGIKPDNYLKNKTYDRGLYCSENTTNISWGGVNLSEEGKLDLYQKEIPRLVTTHLLVAARFIPQVLITDEGIEVTGNLPARLEKYLPAMNNDKEEHKSGTYFVYNGRYYNYEGMQYAIKAHGVARSAFITYEGGIGYYYTYIDGKKSENGVIGFSQNSGILRNYCYILRITEFSIPSPLPQTMRVTMEVKDWVTSSGNEIVVRPEW